MPVSSPSGSDTIMIIDGVAAGVLAVVVDRSQVEIVIAAVVSDRDPVLREARESVRRGGRH